MSVHALRYTGNSFAPVTPHAQKRLDTEFVPGEIYALELADEAASSKSRKYYFAVITEAWKNLPEPLLDEFPSRDHLRKYALIKIGWCTITKTICVNNTAARIAARGVSDEEDYAIAEVVGRVLTIYRAKSQKGIKGKKFREQKEAVFMFLASLIGTDPTSLVKAAD